MGSLAPLSVAPSSSPGITVQSLAELRRVVAKFQIDHTAWTENAHFQQIYWQFKPKTRICGIIAETSQAYAGVTGPIYLMVGTGINDDSYIVKHEVFSAPVTRGLQDAELGSRLNRANAVQGGDIDRHSWTAGNVVAVTLTAPNANLGNGTATNLTAGSTTLYVITESMP